MPVPTDIQDLADGAFDRLVVNSNNGVIRQLFMNNVVASGSDVEIDVTGAAATIALDGTQSSADFIYVKGTLAQNTTIEIEYSTPRSFFVSRATTGAFTLHVKKAGAVGTGQLINAGEFVAVRMVA